MSRSEVLQGILGLFAEPAYLEIGVNEGATFFALRAARKVAVDPRFRFDVGAARAREPGSEFFEVESDVYFGECARRDDRFHLIYLDGLHTFEQTLRDFCNAISFLAGDGVVVVDDVLPNSYAASLADPSLSERLKGALNDSDQSWMGDVYRLVFFIESYFQQYDYATVAENHGQLVVWRGRGQGREAARRGIEEIARKPFESVVTDKESFRRSSCADIIERLRRRGE